MLRFFPRPSIRRSALTTLLLAVALVSGPLAFAPAQAAVVTTSGQVTDETGAPLGDVAVIVWVKDENQQAYFQDDDLLSFTRDDGTYQLDLEPGTYKLRFYADEFHRPEYYDDQATLRDATPVVVADTAQVLVDAELEAFPTITGSVKADDGSAVPWAYVVAYSLTGSEVGYAETESDGTFEMPVEPGTYRLGFSDDDDSFVDEYWQDKPTFQTANSVVVGQGGVTGIDARVAFLPAPVRTPVLNYAPPRVEGWTAVGQVAKVTDGVWGSTVSISRQWFRDGSPIPGATAQQYKITAADLGSTLSAQVTATPTSSPESASTQTVRLNGIVRWTTKVAVTAKRGTKKATLTVRVTSAGGRPSGWVTVKLRGRVVGTGKVTNGRATVTIKKLTKTKKRYAVVYAFNGAFHGSRRDVSARAK